MKADIALAFPGLKIVEGERRSDVPARVSGAFHGMVGRSDAMTRLYERIERFARSPIPILILGETGTGKEMVAEAIRRIAGPERPYIALNCAAVPRALLESELFGHEAGAFTGAQRRHAGVLSQVDGGILFLDEIGELPPSMQAKLLRAIDTGEFRAVGGERTLRSSFRVLAATNRNLRERIAQKRFRLDLYHRLGTARLVVPPLRERREDIAELAEAFLRASRNTSAGPVPTRISPCAIALLQKCEWDGNVRELRNVISAASALADSDVLDVCHLAEFVTAADAIAGRKDGMPSLADSVRQTEYRAITEALRRAQGDREGAARLLGISAATLYRRIARMGRPGETAT